MTGTKKFGDAVQWDAYEPYPGAGWPMPGRPSDYISVDDPYWGHVLDRARDAYGDPNIHFDTDSPTDYLGDPRPRHLVFGDGTKLPADGTVVYHDAASGRNWAQNDDGTTSLVGSDGVPGPSVAPAGYRKVDDNYAPVDAHGQQIAPQLGGLPDSGHGFYTDPKTGVLTPKNVNGDYYTLGPDGKRFFFDKDGKPISAEQFNSPKDPRAQAPAPEGSLVTDEQQSGRTADAVKNLQEELKERFTTLTAAEDKLSEVLLNAHATTAEGKAKLNDIQKKIVEAVNNPAMDTNTAAGEKAYLTFLRSQMGAIQDLLSSSSLSAEDQSKTAQALAALYAAESKGGSTARGQSDSTSAPAPEAADPALTDPGLTDAGVDLGPPPPMPDPSLADVMGGPMSPLGADPMSSMASMLPGALGSLGGLGAGASPLDGLAGLAGVPGQLAGLASGLGSQGGLDRAADTAAGVEDKTEPVEDKDGQAEDEAKPHDVTVAPEQTQGSERWSAPSVEAPGAGEDQLPGEPPAPVVEPVAASSTVELPDGSTAQARTPQAAQAVRDWLSGGTVDASYRQNGMTLPPVGTPVTDGVPPTQLHCGDVAMFKDHYEPVLSSVKGFLNGNVVPLSQVTSSPDFLGFIDPTAAVSAAASQGSPAPAAVPASPPAQPMAASPAPAVPTG